MAASYEEILKEKVSLSDQTSVPDFFKSSSGTWALPPALLDIGAGDPDEQAKIPEEVPSSQTAICLLFHIFCKYFVIINISFY
jgi:hypothetical protein